MGLRDWAALGTLLGWLDLVLYWATYLVGCLYVLIALRAAGGAPWARPLVTSALKGLLATALYVVVLRLVADHVSRVLAVAILAVAAVALAVNFAVMLAVRGTLILALLGVRGRERRAQAQALVERHLPAWAARGGATDRR
jgi:hypothetical protein